MIEEGDPMNFDKLGFDNADLSFLFALILNITKDLMAPMKNSFIVNSIFYFKNEVDYRKHVIPLFINENMS